MANNGVYNLTANGAIIELEEQDGIDIVWVGGYILAGALVFGGIMILLPIVLQGGESTEDDESLYSYDKPLTPGGSKIPENTNPPKSIYLDDVEQQRLKPQEELSPQQGSTPQQGSATQQRLATQQGLAFQQDLTLQQELATQPLLLTQQELAPQQGLLTQQELASQQGLLTKQELAPQEGLLTHQELAPQEGLLTHQGLIPQEGLLTQQELAPQREQESASQHRPISPTIPESLKEKLVERPLQHENSTTEKLEPAEKFNDEVQICSDIDSSRNHSLQNENNSTGKFGLVEEFNDEDELCSNRDGSRNYSKNKRNKMRQNRRDEEHSSNSSRDRRRLRNEESHMYDGGDESYNNDRSRGRSVKGDDAHVKPRKYKRIQGNDDSTQQKSFRDGNDYENEDRSNGKQEFGLYDQKYGEEIKSNERSRKEEDSRKRNDDSKNPAIRKHSDQMSATEKSIGTSITTRKGEMENQQEVKVDVKNSDSKSFQKYMKEDDDTSFQVTSQVLKDVEDDKLSKSQIRKKYMKKILPLLEKYFPNKASSVDEMMNEFHGKEHLLYDAVKAKADREEKKITKYREMLTQTLDIPVDEVDQVLREWKGREDVLIESLQFLQDNNIMDGSEVVDNKYKIGARNQNEEHKPNTHSLMKMKEKISYIVQHDHPEWISNVDEMLLEFQGREHELLSALQIKSEAKRREKEENEAAWYQDQIRDIIYKSIPHMIDDIDEILKEFSGKEQKLLDALIYKSQKITEFSEQKARLPLSPDGLEVIYN